MLSPENTESTERLDAGVSASPRRGSALGLPSFPDGRLEGARNFLPSQGFPLGRPLRGTECTHVYLSLDIQGKLMLWSGGQAITQTWVSLLEDHVWRWWTFLVPLSLCLFIKAQDPGREDGWT